jgi:hypothetical protein
MPQTIPSDGVGLCPDLFQEYTSLKDGDDLRKMIDEMSDILLENCMVGDKIQRNRIPKYYIEKYGVNNLYRYRLQGGLRGIYTILVKSGQINSWILDILNHKEYEKRFGY